MVSSYKYLGCVADEHLTGREWWCDQGVIRGRRERYVAECCLEECEGRMEKGDA